MKAEKNFPASLGWRGLWFGAKFKWMNTALHLVLGNTCTCAGGGCWFEPIRPDP
jgi:hypothetical protein